MRAFVAVELSPGVREVITRGLGELRRRLGSARWVRAEGLHVTMRFLGEQSGEWLDGFAAGVAALLREEAPVEVELGGGGFFPHERRPRVAWLGGLGPGMERWASAIERCATAHGLAPEPRPFSLHVTLARLDRPWGAGDVETFRVAVGKWRFAPFVAREVVLFSSELLPSGAVYTPLRRIAVGV
jgi:2'-5' RNA ligase